MLENKRETSYPLQVLEFGLFFLNNPFKCIL